MSFELHEVTSPSEFDAIWPVRFKAFQTPYNACLKFFNPIHTTLDAAIEASKARHIQVWKDDPACHWVKVIEMESGKVAGAACWNINLEVQAPSETKEPFNAYWHIEGSDEKAFAEKLIGGMKSFVAERVTGPHLELGVMVVDPDYRRQGVARMLMEWGTRKADGFGVDTIIVSAPYAAPAYEKCGFGRVEQIDIDFTIANPSEKWIEYQKEDLRSFLMWKPAGRDYQPGDSTVGR